MRWATEAAAQTAPRQQPKLGSLEETMPSSRSVQALNAPSRRALVPLDRQPSLTERVLHQLRDAIVRHELTPGQPVGIEQLAGLLGVSRTPVREALPALHQ